MVAVSEHLDQYPSLNFKAESIRNYLYDNHFTGYVGKINQKEYDKLKDQSYVLWGLEQALLQRTLFPLGQLLKTEVRQIAHDLGLENLAKKSESYEICFIPDNDYRSFLKSKVPNFEDKIKKGNFINTQGEVIGEHLGYPFYTIGQRKKLGSTFGKPVYVVDINVEANTITLGEEKDLLENEIFVHKINLMKYDSVAKDKLFTTKIRYRDNGLDGKIDLQNNKAKITFLHAPKSPTPGQSAVFYENEDVVGGGFIYKKMDL